MRQFLLRPSVKLNEIQARLDAVGELVRGTMKRDKLRRSLEAIGDIDVEQQVDSQPGDCPRSSSLCAVDRGNPGT
jgi:hypothetical protein